MIFNGLSIVLLGGGIAAIGIFILSVPPPPGGGPGPEAIAVFYIASRALVLACGALNAVAGFLVMRFRGRVFGLVALFANIVVILSCPLAITAIGMMVYGLIA